MPRPAYGRRPARESPRPERRRRRAALRSYGGTRGSLPGAAKPPRPARLAAEGADEPHGAVEPVHADAERSDDRLPRRRTLADVDAQLPRQLAPADRHADPVLLARREFVKPR